MTGRIGTSTIHILPPQQALSSFTRRTTSRKPKVVTRFQAKAAAGSRGFAVTFTGPAAEAHVRGCVDGYNGCPNAATSYSTLDEQESYDYGWHSYRREPRDRHGHVYEQGLF